MHGGVEEEAVVPERYLPRQLAGAEVDCPAHRPATRRVEGEVSDLGIRR